MRRVTVLLELGKLLFHCVHQERAIFFQDERWHAHAAVGSNRLQQLINMSTLALQWYSNLDAPPSLNVKIQFLKGWQREESGWQGPRTMQRQSVALQTEGMTEWKVMGVGGCWNAVQ